MFQKVLKMGNIGQTFRNFSKGWIFKKRHFAYSILGDPVCCGDKVKQCQISYSGIQSKMFGNYMKNKIWADW